MFSNLVATVVDDDSVQHDMQIVVSCASIYMIAGLAFPYFDHLHSHSH